MAGGQDYGSSFGSPVALGIKSPSMSEAMTPISTMLNARNAAQQYQRGAVDLEQSQMDLQERNALRDLAGKFEKYKLSDGNLDMTRLVNDATQAAPKLGMQWAQHIASAHAEGIKVNSDLTQLTQDRRKAIGEVVMSVADQPYEVQEKMIDNVVAGNQGLSFWGDMAKRHLKNAAQQGPEAARNTAYNIAKATMKVGEQAEVTTPGGYQASNNAQTGLMNLKPMAGPVGIVPGTVVNQQLPLGERENVSISPVTASPMTTKKDAFGRVLGVEQTPNTGGGGRIPQLAPGEVQEIPQRTQERVSVNMAAAKVPEQHFNNREIIRLADQGFAGSTGQALSKVFSTYGLQFSAGDKAGNMQRLGHFMALQAQANSQAMGAGTDAARGISEQATGSTSWTPEAIKSTAKVNDALSTGVDLFNRGMEKAIEKAGGNVLAKRTFQNAWSQNFDVRAMQLHNAIADGDRAETKRIVDSVGGAGSQGAKDLLRKGKNIDKLATDGSL